MRLYLYLNKKYLQLLAPKILVGIDVDYYEYSERRSCTISSNVGVKPELMFKNEEKNPQKRVELLNDNGEVNNVEVTRRYINIDDMTIIKNNSLYFNIVENIVEDNRIKNVHGIITDILDNNLFVIDNIKIIYDKEIFDLIHEMFEYKCDVNCLLFVLNEENEQFIFANLLTLYLE